MSNPAEKLLHRTDFPLLRDQIKALNSIRREVLSDEQADALEGVMCILDAIRDLAVDSLGYEEKDVFNLSDTE